MSVTVVARRAAIAAWDAIAWVVAVAILLLVRYDLAVAPRRWDSIVGYVVAAIALQWVAGYFMRLYLGRNRVGSFSDITLLGGLVGGTAIAVGLAFLVFDPDFPAGVAVFVPPMALLFMVMGRWFRRTITRVDSRRAPSAGAPPAIVYGAGDVGFQIARLMDTTDSPPPYSIVGFVDDDPAKRHLRVRSYRVLGKGDELEQLAEANEVSVVILAVSEAKPSLFQDLSDRCRAANLKLVVVPPLREMIDGRVEIDKLREFNVVDLLGRRPLSTDVPAIAGYLHDRVVLVTGAGGSIGSELARQVHELGPSKLILLDRDESALHAVQLTLYGHGLLDTDDIVLCDIRDHEALVAAFHRHQPEVVFHAAALKHLPMLEQYPDEGWKTNVLGTLNVLECAAEVGVRHFVNISTDKAADPSAVLGQTKRLAERLTAHFARGTHRPWVSVRFGNVLGSRGSVLHAFTAQIARGGPVTVTDPDVMRYFMTVSEACELVLQAGAIGEPGDVLVLDMGDPVRIVDVARRLIEESGRSIAIEYTGLRRGEKMNEALFSASEVGRPSSHRLITCVEAPPIDPHDVVAAEAWSELSPEAFRGAGG